MVRGKDLSDFERGFIVGARRAGASVTRTAQLANVSIGTVAKVTSAFRATGKTSVSRVGNCGRQRTLDDHDARALVQFVKKNRSATLAQVTQNLNAGRNQTVSARTVRRQLHREGYYKEVEGQKALGKGQGETQSCGQKDTRKETDRSKDPHSGETTEPKQN